MKDKRQGFTLVELIVVITILAILWTIGFISLSGYALTSRDTVRVSDINNITKVIELYKLQEGVYPVVTNPIEISFSGAVIWKQWSFGSWSRLQAKRISEVPIDPLTGSEYAYSVTQETQEYQLWVIIEWVLVQENIQSELYTFAPVVQAENVLARFATTKINGNYNGKFLTYVKEISPTQKEIYILWVPTILANVIANTTLEDIITNNKFVYEGGNNFPSTYSWSLISQGDWTFSPVSQNDPNNVWDYPIGLIYKGTSNDLSTTWEKLTLINNIKNYYASTDVEGSKAFEEIKIIETSSNPSLAAVDLINAYVGTNVWGIWEERTLVVASDTSNLELPTCSVGWSTIIHWWTITTYLTASVAFWNTCSSETRTCNEGVLSGTFTNTSCSVQSNTSCVFGSTNFGGCNFGS